MRIVFTRGGEPKYNYVHAHVGTKRQGRVYLGTITKVFRDEDQSPRARVTFFNGESWPFDPLLVELEVLERTYESNPAGE